MLHTVNEGVVLERYTIPKQATLLNAEVRPYALRRLARLRLKDWARFVDGDLKGEWALAQESLPLWLRSWGALS